MDAQAFADFTAQLTARLEADTRVISLVAVGSMAHQDTAPDAWSDHDFFVVTHSGAQEPMRQDLGWLPDSGGIVLALRETEHGLKVLYRSAHLIEFAVFDRDELRLARINRSRVLFDRGGVSRQIEEIAQVSRDWARTAIADDAWLLGQLVTTLLVAGGRARRGEELSAQAMLGNATRVLLQLIAKHVPSEASGVLDNLDPHRRFERAHPELAARIVRGQRGGALELTRTLAAVSEEVLAPRVAAFPREALAVVSARLG